MAKFITYPENKSHVVKAPEISVLVPVMNEAGNIRPLIDEICDTFNGRQFEIIYIDDGSKGTYIFFQDSTSNFHLPQHTCIL